MKNRLKQISELLVRYFTKAKSQNIGSECTMNVSSEPSFVHSKPSFAGVHSYTPMRPLIIVSPIGLNCNPLSYLARSHF